MKKLIAALLCLVMSASMLITPTWAAESFEKGKSGTFFAPVFNSHISGYEFLADKYYLDKETLVAQGPKIVAKTAAAKLESLPEGRRIIQISSVFGKEFVAGMDLGFFVTDKAFNETKNLFDGFFKELNALGAKLDIVFDDDEAWPSVYSLENRAISNFRKAGEDLVASYTEKGHLYEAWIKEKLLEIQQKPIYINKLRPMLEENGFVFSENYDLEYVNIFPGAIEPRNTRFYESNPPEGAERAFQIFNDVVVSLAEEKYNEAYYETIKQYYPDVKYSNYGTSGTSGKIDVYDLNGNRTSYKGDPKQEPIVGTHGNVFSYGKLSWAGWLETRPPINWPFEKYDLNGFNLLKRDIIKIADVYAAHDGMVTSWVSNRRNTYDNTDYYTEMVFHVGLFNPDPFLYFANPGTPSEDNDHLGEIFAQLDMLVGFDDRKPLADTDYVTEWDDRYVLSGMDAGGKSVWRITPDLYTPGITMESFLVNKKTPAFRIGNQNIEFPEGSFIYEPEEEEKISEYGYWVIAPLGTRPKEYRDKTHAMNAAPAPKAADGTPTGYMYDAGTQMPTADDLSRSKFDRMNNAASTTPDDGENTDEPVIQEPEFVELTLDPLMGDGTKVVALKEDLPFDARNHWAEHTLSNMFALGIMKGTDKGLMEPEKDVTRAEFITMLERILGVKTIAYEGDIADIAADAWYADIMNTAVKGGWSRLDANGCSRAEEKISRSEMCEVLVYALKLTAGSDKEFTDSLTMGEKARKDVSSVAQIGLIEGYEDGSFRPYGVLTRAETATVFERLLLLIPTLFAE